MRFDIQIYNKDKQVFARKDMLLEQAREWLVTKNSKDKDFTQIDIQMYTVEGMPVDDISTDTYGKAMVFLDDCLGNVISKKYKNIRYG